jgi:hypothetical protein
MTTANLSGLSKAEALVLANDPYYQPIRRDWAYEVETPGWHDTGRDGSTITIRGPYSTEIEDRKQSDFQNHRESLVARCSLRRGFQTFCSIDERVKSAVVEDRNQRRESPAESSKNGKEGTAAGESVGE